MTATPPLTAASAHHVVLVFLSSLAAPVALYTDNPVALYEDIKRIMQAASEKSPKLIEKTGQGPLRKVSFLDTQVIGVALQNEAPTGK
jgi:hypothetical protein